MAAYGTKVPVAQPDTGGIKVLPQLAKEAVPPASGTATGAGSDLAGRRDPHLPGKPEDLPPTRVGKVEQPV
jgi:hypothetical protein